ncbi:MAG: Trk system potassium transporter TrkA [Clostridia bacterium]|nr:Trk system potassium transporter TrkA [Clostridia bacterium]
MRILVVGAGKVGATLAEHLTNEAHDVVVIDSNEEVLRRCEDLYDVMCIHGNGANAQTLLDAGVDHTDILIAATAGDEINMLCCLIGKRLGAKYAIARIRDPKYNESLTLLQHELGIDLAVNPERATALEISRLLRFPFASNIESFAKGLVEMVEFRVQQHDAVAGCRLRDLSSRLPGLPRVLYAAVERGGQVTIPMGDYVISAGDRVFVAGDQLTITNFFRYLGRDIHTVKNVMILGGGRISYYLARMVTPLGMRVSLIEINPEKAARLSEDLPQVNVLLGDGTNQELLDQEGLQQMDAFITLCDRDEENLMTGLYASTQGVPKVIVKNNRVNYADVISRMGLDTIISPRQITSAYILRYVRARISSHGTKVEKLYRLLDGKAEALEFLARSEDPYIGIPLKDLTMRPNSLVAVIVRRGKVIVPFGNDTIESGDSVVIITCESGLSDLNEVIRK